MLYNDQNRPKTQTTDVPNDLYKTYIRLFNVDGSSYLKETGSYNIDEKIQEARNGTELNSLLDKLNIKDESLNEKLKVIYNGEIQDFTNVPDSWVDVNNKLAEGKAFFESQPNEVKTYFNNDYTSFLQNYETYLKSQKTTIKTEKEGEQNE